MPGSQKSPQQKGNNTSVTTPQKSTSGDTLSSSVSSQVTKKPVEGTPRTSTPEKHDSLSLRGRQQNISGFQNETLFPNRESCEVRRKPFHVSNTVVSLIIIQLGGFTEYRKQG